MRHPSEAVRVPLAFAIPVLLALVLPTACAAPDVPEPEPSDAVAYQARTHHCWQWRRHRERHAPGRAGEPDGRRRRGHCRGAGRRGRGWILTGRTVMQAIVDTHVHLREARDDLVEDLQRKAYYGVGVVLSLGRGASDTAFEVRDETLPNAARYRTVGRGITGPETGPHRGSLLGHHRGRGQSGCAGARDAERRLGQDLGRRTRRTGREAAP